MEYFFQKWERNKKIVIMTNNNYECGYPIIYIYIYIYIYMYTIINFINIINTVVVL